MFAFKDAGGCWSFLMNNRCCYSDCTPHKFRNGKMGRSQNWKQRHWRSYFSTRSRVLNYWHIPFCIICESLSFCIGSKTQHDCTLRFCTSWVIIIKRLKWHQNCCCHQQMWCHVCEHKSSHSRSAASAYIYLCYNHQTEILRWRQCCDSNTLVARGAYFIEMCC